MNSCSLGHPDASFDAVIDKAMLDSLLCGEASTANAGRYVSEVARVLKPGGTFIIVSFGTPENRLSYLEGDYGWQVTVHSIPKPTVNTAGLPEVNSSDPSHQHVRASEVERGGGCRAQCARAPCLLLSPSLPPYQGPPTQPPLHSRPLPPSHPPHAPRSRSPPPPLSCRCSTSIQQRRHKL